MKKFFFLVIALGGPLFFGGAQEKVWQNSDFQLSWKIEGTSLVMTVSAATSGWVAVGFNPSSMMKDANIIMGAILPNGTTVIEDHFGTSLTAHRKDSDLGGTNDVRLISGEEKNGKTTITFSIPLNSGDRYDRPLAGGSKVTVLLALANQDNLTSKHNKRTKVELTL
ncbi:MAG: DOMON domain-containing protein [Treponemataceae bacterium]|nr:DOMON domain-containing protein [Treponemataceae bacterium]